MPTICQTFYVSRARSAFDESAVRAILASARRHNPRLGISGCLLFSGRCFAQVLEGERAAVDELAARIATDPRHDAVRFLHRASRSDREYADWPMGYLHDVNLEDDLETLLLIPDRSPVVVADVMERMRPDPVMGALR
jgi:hypothetical protein